MDRRHFLRTGALAAGIAATGAHAHTVATTAPKPSRVAARRFALGYLMASDHAAAGASQWVAYPRAPRGAALDAAVLLRVTVHGLHAAPDSHLRALAVAPLFRVPELAEPVPFHAWSFDARQRSAPVRFQAAADAIAGFAVDYEVDSAAGGCVRDAELCAVHGVLVDTLLPGRYVLAGPRQATGVAPAFHRLALAADGEAMLRSASGRRVDFDYLAFTVTRA
jgi:hypothetical protein